MLSMAPRIASRSCRPHEPASALLGRRDGGGRRGGRLVHGRLRRRALRGAPRADGARDGGAPREARARPGRAQRAARTVPERGRPPARSGDAGGGAPRPRAEPRGDGSRPLAPGDRRSSVRGLPPAPPGKAYALWSIADAAPRPAGVLRVDAEGRGSLRLAPAEGGKPVKVFAITLEPEVGVAAPSGPMVLRSK